MPMRTKVCTSIMNYSVTYGMFSVSVDPPDAAGASIEA